jgi:lactoylglutathione lyase
MPTQKKTSTKKKANTQRATPRKGTVGRTSARSGKTTTPRPKPAHLDLRSAAPSLTTNDLGKSLPWYRDVLGFKVDESWDDDGKPVGAMMSAGRVSFYLSQDDWKKGRDRAKGEGFRIYCDTTQPVDDLAAQIRDRGGKIVDEPHDEPWGGRAFSVSDPDGFKITITNG